jgi:hypothetical protein
MEPAEPHESFTFRALFQHQGYLFGGTYSSEAAPPPFFNDCTSNFQAKASPLLYLEIILVFCHNRVKLGNCEKEIKLMSKDEK